jgi:hypothetical protein
MWMMNPMYSGLARKPPGGCSTVSNTMPSRARAADQAEGGGVKARRRQGKKQSWRRWSEQDLSALRDGWKGGMSVEAIAHWIGRHPGSVANKIAMLGLGLSDAEYQRRVSAGAKEGARRRHGTPGRAPENMIGANVGQMRARTAAGRLVKKRPPRRPRRPGYGWRAAPCTECPGQMLVKKGHASLCYDCKLESLPAQPLITPP